MTDIDTRPSFRRVQFTSYRNIYEADAVTDPLWVNPAHVVMVRPLLGLRSKTKIYLVGGYDVSVSEDYPTVVAMLGGMS